MNDINLQGLDSDGNEKEYSVWKEKSMYGKKYVGIKRSTFIIDKLGKIEKEWHKVKIKGHVDEVIEFIKNKIDNIITKKRVIKEELG